MTGHAVLALTPVVVVLVWALVERVRGLMAAARPAGRHRAGGEPR